MATKYDSNGEYGSYTGDRSDFKRKIPSDSTRENPGENKNAEEENDDVSNGGQKAGEYISELLQEKQSLENAKFPHCSRFIDQEIQKVQNIGKAPPKEFKYVDIYRERPMKVAVKVLVPVREHPKFNFVGKLLGPKGNSMKRLQEETMCKMAVLGRGSMKDRQREEELRKACDPKYAHLSDDLHVEISALGPPAEAHARVAFALAEVRKYLIPDNNDNIRQEQMREMEIMTADNPNDPLGPPRARTGGSSLGRGKRLILAASVPHPPLQMRTATRTPVTTPRVMPAKTKIMSILDRARIAMEESYGYEEPYEPTEPSYDYSPPPTHYRSSSTSQQYEQDYEPEYFRESSASYADPPSQRWKSSYKTTSTAPSRHSESTSRYRSSPYSRPTSKYMDDKND